MPLNLTDESMDQISALPDEEALKFFKALTPEERAEVDTYMSGWKQRKARPAVQESVAPSFPAAFDPADPQFQPQPQTARGAPPFMQSVRDFGAKVQDFSQNFSVPHLLEKAADHTIVPAVQSFQEHIGRPVAESMIDAFTTNADFDRMARGESPERRAAGVAATEDVLSSAATPWAGPGIAQDFNAEDPARAEMARQQIAKSVPSIFGFDGAQVVDAAAPIAGQGPLLLLGAPKAFAAGEAFVASSKFAQSFPVLGRILGAAAGGATEGVLLGAGAGLASEDISLTEGAVGGGLVGGGLSGVAGAGVEGVSAAAKGAKTLFQLTREGGQALADEVERWLGPSSEPIAGLATRQAPSIERTVYGDFQVPEAAPIQFKGELPEPVIKEAPSLEAVNAPFAMAGRVDEKGRRFVTVIQISKNGQEVSHKSMPLETIEDAFAIFRYRTENGIGPVNFSKKFLESGDVTDPAIDVIMRGEYLDVERLHSTGHGGVMKESTVKGTVAQRDPRKAPENTSPGMEDTAISDTLVTADPSIPFAPSAKRHGGETTPNADLFTRNMRTGEVSLPDMTPDAPLPNPGTVESPLNFGAFLRGERTVVEGPDIQRLAKSTKLGKTPFGSQKFPVELEVKVTWADGSVHTDTVKGLNKGHALSRAAANWPDASRVEVRSVLPEEIAHDLGRAAKKQMVDVPLDPTRNAILVKPASLAVVPKGGKMVLMAKNGGKLARATKEDVINHLANPDAPPVEKPPYQIVEVTPEGDVRIGRASDFIPPAKEEHQPVVEWAQRLEAPPETGEKVFIGPATTDREGNPIAIMGRVVGRDPKKPDHWLVKPSFTAPEVDAKGRVRTTGSNATLSIHEDTLFRSPEWIRKLTGEVLGPAPIPVKAGPGDLTDGQLDAVNAMVKLHDLVRRRAAKFVDGKMKEPSAIDKVMEQLLPAHARGSTDLVNRLILRGEGIASLRRPDEIIRSFQAKLPRADRDLWSAASTDLSKLAGGTMRPSMFARKHPEAWRKIQALAHDVLSEMRANSKELESYGVLPQGISSLREEGLVEQYVANVYRLYYLKPGEWAKLVPSDARTEFAEKLAAELHKQRLNFDASTLMAELDEVLKAEDPILSMAKKPWAGPWKRLLERQEIPPLFQRLFGKENSGILRVAISLADQRTMLEGLRLWNRIVNHKVPIGDHAQMANPFFSPGPRPDTPIPVPNNPKLYGPAAGGYVSEELAPIIHINRAMQQGGHGFWRAVGGIIKTNQVVGNPKAWGNNTMRNVIPATRVGAIDPFHPHLSAQRYGRALKLLIEWRNNPTATGDRALVFAARSAGILPSGFGRTEATSAQTDKLFNALKDHYKIKTNETVFDSMKRWGDKVNEVRNIGAEAYDLLGDQWHKFAAYLAIRDRAMKFGWNDEQMIAEYASVEINKAFANFERLAPIVDKIRSSTAGSIAPYFSSIAEEVRTSLSLAKDTIIDAATMQKLLTEKNSPNKEIAFKARERLHRLGRLVGFAAMIWGAKQVIGMERRANGITDEEVEAALELRGQFSKYYRQVLVALPTRTPNGQVDFWDLTQYFPQAQFIAGDPNDGFLSRLFANLYTAAVQGTPFEKLARSLPEKAGLVEPAPEFTPVWREGEEGAVKVINQFAEWGAVPMLIPNAINYTNRAARAPKYNREPTTAGREQSRIIAPVADAVTVPLTPDQTSPSVVRTAQELQAQTQEHQKVIRNIMADPDLPPEEKERLMNAELEKMEQKIQQFQSLQKKIEAAQKAHASQR